MKYDFLNAIIDKKGGTRDYIEYSAPEFLIKGKLTVTSDVWQIGILLFYMIVGRTPFYNESYEPTKAAVLHEDIEWPETINQDAKDIISKILEKDPTNRLKAGDIKNHAFFSDVNWDAVYKQELDPPFFFMEASKYKNATPADLDKIFTTDYYKKQNKDGYGKSFRSFGDINVGDPFLQ